MQAWLVATGLLLLSVASFTLVLPILDFTGIFRQLFKEYPATPEMAARLAFAGVICLVLGWALHRRQGGG